MKKKTLYMYDYLLKLLCGETIVAQSQFIPPYKTSPKRDN